jgi:hypothetical protein
MHIYIHASIYLSIYIYGERERDKRESLEGDKDTGSTSKFKHHLQYGN